MIKERGFDLQDRLIEYVRIFKIQYPTRNIQ